SKMRPREGGSTPLTTLSSVVLPAPFGPMSPQMPPPAVKETSSRAANPPKDRLTPSTRSSAPSVIPVLGAGEGEPALPWFRQRGARGALRASAASHPRGAGRPRHGGGR